MADKNVIVIGGGAAGFFAAINNKLKYPNHNVIILEKTNKLLSKVLVSGGGRCNVTHNCFDNNDLIKNYPRGEKELQQVFSKFSVSDTINWFKSQGITLNAEPDGRMFPSSNTSETIVNCFLNLAKKLSIKILLQHEVLSILKKECFEIKTNHALILADIVICSAGGNSKTSGYAFLKNTGHNIINPIPSLFTINLPNEEIKKELQGVAVKNVKISIENTKHFYIGPLLITHWGLSGPAVIKLSAFAAKHFYETNYKNNILINWSGDLKLDAIEAILKTSKNTNTRSLVINTPLFDLPKRIWAYLILKAGINETTNWSDLKKELLLKLATLIHANSYKMEGKTTFKEEFVTAGGIDLKEINFKTMESKLIQGLYFCGEVLNIDGITGGFNFQAAWSTAYICSLAE